MPSLSRRPQWVQEAKPGDLLVLRVGSRLVHCGVYLGGDQMVEALSSSGGRGAVTVTRVRWDSVIRT
ncbi:MAG: NlpC/P60 family protein, partial [Akkermansiaceae bacterium]